MRILKIVIVGIMVLGLVQEIWAGEVVVVDWSGSVDIPDRGTYSESYVISSVPQEAYVTGVLIEVLIDDRGNDNFWCSDYEIKLSCDTQGGSANYYLLWDDAREKTDGDADDDLSDDSDIELSLRIMVFNGENPNQQWYFCIEDAVSFHATFPPQDGLGAIKRIRFVIQYAEAPRLFVDASAQGNNDGSRWPDAFIHLQDALAVAQPGDEICVAGGTYTPDLGSGQQQGDRTATFMIPNGVSIIGGFAGVIHPAPDLRAIELYPTILSGDLDSNDRDVADPCELLTEPTMAENSLHVIMAVNCDETTVLDGLTITAGNANLDTTPENRGAGLYNNPASLIVRDCTFTRNAASWFGAGMYNDWNSRSEPNVIRCTFRENAVNRQGAGLYNHATCNPTLTECLFERNFATIAGAAIKLGESRATMIGCRFINNNAEYGAAIHAQNNDSEYVLTECTFEGNQTLTHGGAIRDVNSVSVLTDCTFTSNISGRGGAASFSSGSVTDLIHCHFIGNEAEVHGGAIYANTVDPFFVDCLFFNNIAAYHGGAIHNYLSPQWLINCYLASNVAGGGGGGIFNNNSEATYCGSVFSANTAVGRGGGINNYNCELPCYSINCTFVGNSSDDAGGGTADVNSVHVLTNSILWGNRAPKGPQSLVRNYIASLTVNYCDLQGGQSDVQVVDAELNWGIGNIATDPLFVDVNGPDHILGTVDDQLALRGVSPCIDAGDNTAVPDDIADIDIDDNIHERLPFDAAGNRRFTNNPGTADTGIADLPDYRDVVDIGAYEFLWDMSDSSASGLVASYDFDGDASDSSGHGLHGTMHNGARIINDPQRNLVLSLDGFDDYVRIPKSEHFNTTSVTVSVWIKPNRVDQFMRIIRLQGVYELYVHPDEVLISYLRPTSRGGNTYIQLLISRISTGEWRHAAFTWDARSGHWRCYLNGFETSSKDEEDNNPLVTQYYGDFIIGALSSGVGHFDGLIDEVAVYDRALSSHEILDIYSSK